MYIKRRFSVLKIIKKIWFLVLTVTIYAALVDVLYQKLGWTWLSIPVSVPALLGTAISLLLGFRTNSAYDRWWEARKVWGAIVNDSRTLLRQGAGFFDVADSEKNSLMLKLAHSQIAWCYALTSSLRNLPVIEKLAPFLSENQIREVAGHANVPNAILLLQEKFLKEAYQKGYLDSYQFVRMDETLQRLCDSMGKCERIKNTVFPTQYSFFIHYAILVFTLLLPMGLVEYMQWVEIFVTFIVSFLFFMIEIIAFFMQDPFENAPNDIPMSSLSRTIEINLLQQVGATQIPEKLAPVHGYLL